MGGTPETTFKPSIFDAGTAASAHRECSVSIISVMDSLLKPGRILLAIAIACFGLHYLAFAAGLATGAPGPPWFPGPQWVSWAAGIGLLAAGISLLIDQQGQWAALLLGLALLLRVLVVHLPRTLANVHDPGPWTSAGEILSICGGVLVLEGSWAKGLDGDRLPGSSSTTFFGQYLFAFPLFIFGAQHLIYGQFVATLVPSWIPARLFWAYFIGAAFIAAALAILTRRLGVLAAALLGLMFFLWLLIVHIPRVVVSPHSANEWTSTFVALAMSGSALAVAGTLARRE
jgi:uncharacterized membrane protein